VATAGTVVKRRPFLRGMKVRIKELAQEAKFIRFEENKIKSNKLYIQNYDDLPPERKAFVNQMACDHRELRSHRKVEVREAARAAQLAYGFLRDIPYSEIENKRKPEKEYRFNNYIKPEIKRLTKKFGKLYGKENYDEEIEKWLTT
jgi:hypothetical protein